MSKSYEKIDRFTRIMSPVNKIMSVKKITDALDVMGFFSAPASTCHHGSFEGGLFEHSYRVTTALVDLTERMNLAWNRPESPYIIGMFHDLCKCDQYELDASDTKTYTYRKDTLLKGHGDKSVMMASMIMSLTYEEILCIRYHMGAFIPKEEWNDYTAAIHNRPNVLWTHTADMIAAHIKEV